MIVSLCFFVSGTAALILQVLWTRLLGHVFGASALAVAATLTAFMGGLALGATLGGKRAAKTRHPLLVFAVLEGAVGIYGLFVPTLLGLLPDLWRIIGSSLTGHFFLVSLVRFVFVFAILLVPTTAMGATLPLLAQGVVKIQRELGARVGELYAANTFGAVVGAFVGGFILIPTFGIHATVTIAACAELLVAVGVVVLWRVGHGDRVLTWAIRPGTPDAVFAMLEPVEVLDATQTAKRLARIAFAISGAAAMMLEVFWTRAIGVVIGANTYAFTLILCTFLFGLALGAAWMSSRVDRIARPVRALAWAQGLAGVFSISTTAVIDKMPHLLHAVASDLDAGHVSIYFVNLAISALVMLPTTLTLGAVMPLIMRILEPKGEEPAIAGQIVGRAYAWNTVGAIVGSFLAGFVLLPWIGVQRGLMLSSLLFLGLSALLLLVPASATDTARPRASRPIALVALGIALLFVRPTWDVPTWTAGLFRFYLTRSVYRAGFAWSGKLLFHKDGVASTVTVEGEEDGDGVSLKVNGKVDASDYGDMPTQILSGLLPVLLHERPARALVIGFGSGVTSGAILTSPIERLDTVEIESAVFEASREFFRHVNHEPFKDPRFFPVVDDGRNFLLVTDARYDIIISEPSNPWMTGAASLFTKEFFEAADARLADGGVFLQWVQLYELSPANIKALFKTFHSVFPHVVVFTPSPRSNDTLVLGSRSPIAFSRARIQDALLNSRTGPELKRAEIHAPEDFIGLLLAAQPQVELLVEAGALNTDDNALIEFSAPKDLLDYALSDARVEAFERLDGERLTHAPMHFSGFDFESVEGLVALTESLLIQGRTDDAGVAIARVRERENVLSDKSRQKFERLDRLHARMLEADQEPVVVPTSDTQNDTEYASAVAQMLEGKERNAFFEVDRAKEFEKRSLAHRFLYAYLAYRANRTRDAEWLIRPVAEDSSFTAAHPEVLYYAARIQTDRGYHREAFRFYEQFLDAKRDMPAREEK